MKFIVAAALMVLSTEARHHRFQRLGQVRGIDEEELQSGAHWRKRWPEGVDHGDDDGEAAVLGRIHVPRRSHKKVPEDSTKGLFDFELEDDVKDTHKSLEAAESIHGSKLVMGKKK